MRSEMSRAHRQHESAQAEKDRRKLAEETVARNAASELLTRHIFFEGNDVLLNAPEITNRLHFRWKELEKNLYARTHRVATLGGVDHPCATIESVIELCDSGRLGAGCMGRLEAYLFLTAADLEYYALMKRGLEFLRTAPRGPATGFNPILEKLFDDARRKIGFGDCVGDDPATWPETLQHAAWSAVEGVPARGAVSRLEDAVPFELCLHNEGGSTVSVYVRSLKGPWGARRSPIWYDALGKWRGVEDKESDGKAG